MTELNKPDEQRQSAKRKAALAKLLTDAQIKRAESLGIELNHIHYLKTGVNDLATKNPELAAEWHPTKNGDLRPTDVTACTHRKVWWLGECGHEWEADVGSRNSGSGCPYCNKGTFLQGFNDLATTNPELVAEWHPTKNGDLEPTDVTAANNRKVWWRHQMPDGSWHEWKGTISGRAGKSKIGCLICSNKQLLVGFNDLATVNPEVAAEWHPTKNGDLKSTDVVAGSPKKVWWRHQMPDGSWHEWDAAIASRNSGCGCPYCSNRKVLQGFNDLATVNPEVAAQWHPTKNGNLKPTDVVAGSPKKVWWLCSECGRSYRKAIRECVKYGANCPECIKKKRMEKLSQQRRRRAKQ